MINKNTGVLIKKPELTDYIASEETGIIYEEVLPCGNWYPFLPTNELQKGKMIDTMACVSFSALNSVEIQLNKMLADGKFKKEAIDFFNEKGYVDNYGKFNFSDRYTAKMSNTTKKGNYLQTVWDSIRNHGLLPEHKWRFNRELWTWEKYYETIPKKLQNEAKEIYKYIEIKYEWVFDNLEKHLLQAPIQIATPVCNGWTTDEIVKNCPKPVQHATVLFNRVDVFGNIILDHYKPFIKILANDYSIPHTMKGVVFLKQKSQKSKKFKHNFEKNLKYSDRNKEVVALQNALKLEGCMANNIKSTGYYGNITRSAIMAFWRKYRIIPEYMIRLYMGRYCGKKTRTKLNELYN